MISNSKQETANSNLVRWADNLSLFVLCVWVAIIATAILVPLYSDEIATKMMQAAAITNGWKFNTLYPECHSDFLLNIPLSMRPAAFAYEMLYAKATPLGIRIISVVTALCCGALLALAVRWVFSHRRLYLPAMAVVAAITGLGVLPLTLGLARAEQWLVLLLTLFVLFPALVERIARPGQRARRLACLIVFCFAASFFFYSHPKAVFFFPVVIVSACFSFRSRNIALCTVAVVFVLACTVQSVSFSSGATKCEDAPILSGLLASQTTALGMLAKSPTTFVHELFTNLTSAPYAINAYLTFQENYQSDWLPSMNSIAGVPWIALTNVGIKAALALAIWLAVLIPPISVVVALLRRIAGYRAALIATLWIGLLGHLMLYKVWTFYGGSLVVPLAALLMLLCAGVPRWDSRCQMWAAGILAPLFVVFLTSALVFFTTVVPRLVTTVHPVGIGLPNQALSIPTFKFAEQREQVRKFARKCGLEADGARRLVVDNTTYFAFDGLREPLHLAYLNEGNYGADFKGDRMGNLLLKIGVKGIIGQCTFLAPHFEAEALKDGNLCCLKLDESR
ncbi:hypothetical protein [Paraburkholderia azotifigens]|uniref:Glycosyltransferase RgtA/B/C/D-like domain-containing protein n=1 Tax=Paraburkholderia azotifigens TaxID=2057004 RepID=A0A5C6VW53_9BURK|nr:hypothetical protein [Paraburkholderia azotifigens]TXC88856.1 hypothetical protein FRZ40_15360 [Paraburkholderia azotifigens]